MHSRATPSTAKLVTAFATVYVVWGSTYLAIRLAVETLPPFSMAGIRFLLAGGVMFALVRLRDRTPLTRRNWANAAVVGTLMLLGGNGLVCWAEQWVASGLAALLIATVPLWMALLEWLLYGGRPPTRRTWAGLLLGLAGIYILVRPDSLTGGEHDARHNLIACGALLLACVFWTLGSLYSRRGGLPKSTVLATAMEMLAGGVALLVVGAATGEPGRLDLAHVSLRALLALSYLVVFGSCLAFTAYIWLLQVCAPAQAATYAYVNPAIAVVLGAAVAGEPLTFRVLAGAAVILAAVVVITRATAAPVHVQTSVDSPPNVPDEAGAAAPADA